MLAGIEETIESSAPVSVCLLPWLENPYRLFTFYEMYRVGVEQLVQIGRVLQSISGDVAADAAPQGVLSKTRQNHLISELTKIKKNCDKLSLIATSGFVASVIQDYSANERSHGQARSSVEYVATTFQQELSRNLFAFIEPAKAKYFRAVEEYFKDPPCGLEAMQSFPRAMRDLALAGNCLASGFNDASVFHLMRVLEKGLEALAKVFSIPFKFENWHNVIEQLESRVRKIDSAFGVDWKDKQKFYSEAACEFMFFKDAWRNHVMHGRDEFDDQRAENIYSHVCAFTRHLALGGLTE